MFDSTVNAILDTPEWRAAAGLPQQSPFVPLNELQKDQRYRSWVRAASKHLRILEAVRGVADENGTADQDESHRLPFHPVHCAASQGMTGAGKLLLQRYNSGSGTKQGALDVVNMPDDALGWTPLHWASVTNRLDFMLLLLEADACVDARDRAGRTPLYACAAFGAVDAAAVLLRRGAAADGPDFRGLTPLHAAAAGNHMEVAEDLVSAGACVRRRSSSGCSPRHVAERQGHASMVELLAAAARREQSEGLAANDPEETMAQIGGGDPLCWLFPLLRASVGGGGRSNGTRSAA
eukprot:g9596.t2